MAGKHTCAKTCTRTYTYILGLRQNIYHERLRPQPHRASVCVQPKCFSVPDDEYGTWRVLYDTVGYGTEEAVAQRWLCLADHE